MFDCHDNNLYGVLFVCSDGILGAVCFGNPFWGQQDLTLRTAFPSIVIMSVGHLGNQIPVARALKR